MHIICNYFKLAITWLLYGLAHKPYENVAVEDHVFQLELLLVLVLVDEGSLKFTLLADVELLHLDLFREVHPVLGHSLEEGLFGAPVDGELLVPLVLLQIVDLVFREGLLLDHREVPVERLHIDADLILVMDDDRYIVLCMCDADVCRAVLEVRLAVVVVVD